MKTYRIYNVVIYNQDEEVLDKPYFELTAHVYSKKQSKIITVDYKVSIGFILEHDENDNLDDKLAKEKVAYGNLKAKVFEVISRYNSSLLDYAPSILFRILYIYGTLAELDYEQEYFLDSEQSLRIAKPLAKVYSLVEEGKKRANEGRGISKEIVFRIGVEDIKFEGNDFMEWVLEVIEKAIVRQDYNLNLGDNMIKLEEALFARNFERINALANDREHKPLIEHSRFLTSFCLNIHKIICTYSKTDDNKITFKQKKLYSEISRLFDVPKWDKYKLENKKNRDAFTKLLIREMSDMIVIK